MITNRTKVYYCRDCTVLFQTGIESKSLQRGQIVIIQSTAVKKKENLTAILLIFWQKLINKK